MSQQSQRTDANEILERFFNIKQRVERKLSNQEILPEQKPIYEALFDCLEFIETGHKVE